MGTNNRDLLPGTLAEISEGLHGIYDLGTAVVVITGAGCRSVAFPVERETWCGYVVRRTGSDAQLILDR